MTVDLLALGETMATFVPADGTVLSAEVSLRLEAAGAESNTCIGLTRLGMRTGWISRLGSDRLGDVVLGCVGGAGVDTRWVRRDASRPTGVMVKDTAANEVLYYRSGSAASALEPDDLDDVPVAAARAVLVCGVTALLSPSAARTSSAFLGAARGTRYVDPNLRSGLWGSSRASELVGPLLRRADVVLAGEGELRTLVGEGTDNELAERVLALGPREVVVKSRERGLLGLDRATGWHSHVPDWRADVDPVGAGDAFNAGYIATRLRGGSIMDALRRGSQCGAAVAGAVGDTAGWDAVVAAP
jgi:2-dehydro-3-deoxygluconokinase